MWCSLLLERMLCSSVGMYLGRLPTTVYSYILEDTPVVEGTDGGFAIEKDEILINQPRFFSRLLHSDGLRLRCLGRPSLEETKTMKDIIFVICLLIFCV